MGSPRSPEVRAKISATLKGHQGNTGSGRPAKLCVFCADFCGRRGSASRGCTARRRDNFTRRAYGLSLEEANALLANGCALCERPAVHIDHDHQTGRVRGALCLPHNRALGNLGDTPESLGRALKYVLGEEA